MSVHTFPTAAAPASGFSCAPSGNSPGAALLNISQVARRLDVPKFGDDRLIGYVGQLVRDHGFPRPFPAPCKGKVVSGVHANSKWRGDAVDAWFDTFLPPDAADALDAKALAAAAGAMDAAAANLRAVR